jgi:hypothetical protein
MLREVFFSFFFTKNRIWLVDNGHRGSGMVFFSSRGVWLVTKLPKMVKSGISGHFSPKYAPKMLNFGPKWATFLNACAPGSWSDNLFQKASEDQLKLYKPDQPASIMG